MLHMEQELINLPEHLRSPWILVRFVLLDLQVSMYCFVDHCLSLCSISFGHCFVYPSVTPLVSSNFSYAELYCLTGIEERLMISK